MLDFGDSTVTPSPKAVDICACASPEDDKENSTENIPPEEVKDSSTAAPVCTPECDAANVIPAFSLIVEAESALQDAKTLDSAVNTSSHNRKHLTSLLLKAAYLNSVDVFDLCVSQGAGVHARDVDGRTLLHYAANSDEEIIAKSIRCLSENSAEPLDIDVLDTRGWTPLLIAAVRGNVGATKMLLKSGADPTRVIQHNSITGGLCQAPALHFAALRGNMSIVKVLLEDGRLSVGTLDSKGRTALYYASARRHVKLMDWLLEKGAAPLTVDDDCRTELFAAVFSDSFQTLKLVLKHLGAEDECPEKRKEAVGHLLHLDKWEISPFQLAVTRQHFELVTQIRGLLKENGFDDPLDDVEIVTGSTLKPGTSNAFGSVHVEKELNPLERTVVNTLTAGLNEPNRNQITRAVRCLGVETCLDIFQKTIQIQQNGGEKTHDGKRKKSAGGVFFTMMKASVKPEQWQFIVKETVEAERRLKKMTNQQQAASSKPPPFGKGGLHLRLQVGTSTGAAGSHLRKKLLEND